MKIERFSVSECCGAMSVMFKLDKSIDKSMLSSLVQLGFTEHEHFTAANMLYATNLTFIVIGRFGANKLQVKCRNSDCTQKLNDFEAILQTLG